jgi:hypothetical protein
MRFQQMAAICCSIPPRNHDVRVHLQSNQHSFTGESARIALKLLPASISSLANLASPSASYSPVAKMRA